MQREVGVDNSDQRHVREVEALGDHLGADEDVDLAGAKSLERFAIRILARHRIGVHPAHDRVGENLGDVRLDFLGAEAGIDQRVLRTGRAFFRHGGRVAAQMTGQPGRATMESERDAAIRAIARFPAIAAEQGGGKPAPI